MEVMDYCKYMKERGMVLDQVSFSILLKGYTRIGNLDAALSLLNYLRQTHLASPSSYTILIKMVVSLAEEEDKKIQEEQAEREEEEVDVDPIEDMRLGCWFDDDEE